jgi:2-polyprenyl-6-methoxyphenol hydroxylase-like FAD-dependent oxidoreductase
MSKVIVVGGGWAGCAAALAAKKAGAKSVTLLERTDMLLGTGLVGGIMRNNGRYTATEELIALGGGDLFKIADHFSRHKNVEFPGHKHASLYDVSLIEPAVRQYLLDLDIDIRLVSRVKDVDHDSQKVKAVITEAGEQISGDVFVETTGTSGPQRNCTKYGNGCAMCVYRCPTFGPRISIAARVGVKELVGKTVI